MIDPDIRITLDMYYQWARINCPSDVYYPHEIPTRRLHGRQVPLAGLTDEEAMWVDRALCRLAGADPEGHTLVQKVHADRKTVRQLEKHGYGSRKRIARVLSSARAYVAGCVAGQSESGDPTPQTTSPGGNMQAG
jgi:hypothetical protein